MSGCAYYIPQVTGECAFTLLLTQQQDLKIRIAIDEENCGFLFNVGLSTLLDFTFLRAGIFLYYCGFLHCSETV